MRARPIQAENLDLVAAILTTSRKTIFPQSTDYIIQQYYEIRNQLHEQELRLQDRPHA